MVRSAADAGNENEAVAIGERWIRSRLTPLEACRLSTQGFVSCHQLPSGSRCAKLRFRDASGRQIVRYLGVDPKLVEGIACALIRRQRGMRRRRSARGLARRGRRQWSNLRKRVAPSLERQGIRFHGLAARRRRIQRGMNPANFPLLTDQEAIAMILPETRDSAAPMGLSSVPHTRIYENLRQWSLESLAPDDVALRHTAAQLMDLSAMLLEPVIHEIRQSDARLEAIEDLSSPIELALKLNRQADRLLNLSYKRTEDQNRQRAKISTVDTYAVEADRSEKATAVAESRLGPQ